MTKYDVNVHRYMQLAWDNSGHNQPLSQARSKKFVSVTKAAGVTVLS